MFSVCTVLLTLLVFAQTTPVLRLKREMSFAELNSLYNTPVKKAEWMERPKQGLSDASPNWAVISHSGVRVTLDDGQDSQYLVHKGPNFGRASDTVVTDANNMSSRWKVKESRVLDGSRTVGDFVKAGGENYRLFRANCHKAARDMMNLDQN